ncbi:MAG: TRAP transporter small permease [Rhodospirillaceae bacterium]|nr:TRAP transporter small permease [Rhodospirillaceae bacterium]
MADAAESPAPPAMRGAGGLGTFAAVVLTGVMMVTVVDVVGRYVFNRPLPGSSEITEILMAILIYAGLPVASARNAHIVVDLLDGVTPAGVARVRDVVMRILSILVLAAISWRLWAYGKQIGNSHDVSEYLRIPLAPFAYVMSGFAALASLVEIYRAFRPAAASASQTT